MHITMLTLTAAGGLASASYHTSATDGEPPGRVSMLARMTGYKQSQTSDGWTPQPTPAPGPPSESDSVLSVLKREITNTWENDETCGWTLGQSCKLLSPYSKDYLLITVVQLPHGHVQQDTPARRTTTTLSVVLRGHSHRSTAVVSTSRPSTAVLVPAQDQRLDVATHLVSGPAVPSYGQAHQRRRCTDASPHQPLYPCKTNRSSW
jgi:hypothetical protein